MIKRTIEISQQAAYLAVKSGQLLIHSRNGHDGALLGRTPCEDVGVLLVDHPAVTYSHAALTTLLEHEAAVILCGRDHLPAGLLLPIGEHSQVVWRIQLQLSVKKPILKQLWRQIIQAKIRAQAVNHPPRTQSRTKLLALARRVKSGDPENIEAHAAKEYWAAWRNGLCGTGSPSATSFRRDPDGPPPNNLLNYGYAVMRAAVARAVVAAGLLPAIGIHHRNRSNAFCLADDLVEPLRPIVDARVAELVQAGESDIKPETKRGLLELLTLNTQTGDQSGPLMVALHRYAASLVKCFSDESDRLEIPRAASAAFAESET